MNIATATVLPMDSVTANQPSATPKLKYKSVPESYKALSETKFRRVVSDLEAVLLDISADGIGVNTPDGRISTETLNSWAEYLRDALETLSKGQ